MMSGERHLRAVLPLSVVLLGTAGALLATRPAWWPWMVVALVLQELVLAATWRRGRVKVWEVLAVAVVLRALYAGLPPLLSDDAFRYVWDGLVQAHGFNPYAFAPEADELARWHDEPFYSQLNSESFFAVYPPLSQLVFRIGTLAYPAAGWLGSFYVVKGIFLVMEIAAVLLLTRETSARHVMLYAWQPLAVLEIAGQAHTEALAVAFLVVAFVAERRGWAFTGGAAVATATWAKLYPALLLPVVVWRFGWRALAGVVVVTVGLWIPYFSVDAVANVAESLRLYVQHFEFYAGPYYVLKHGLYVIPGVNWSLVVGPLLQVILIPLLAATYAHGFRHDWSLPHFWVWLYGAALVAATTLHPWYLLPLLVALPLCAGRGWHWHALALGAISTYVFYAYEWYWPFVVIGWGAWATLGARRYGDDVLQWVQRRRGRTKARWIDQHVDLSYDRRVLDLGAAEGYVGEALAQEWRADVVLADVVDIHRVQLPHVCYDGRTLPFDDDAFDVTILSFVLHHAADQRRVLQEALRVTRDRVVVLESVYASERQHRLLTLLDRWANRVRSCRAMDAQEDYLHFRTNDGWLDLFEQHGAEMLVTERRGRVLHRQRLYVLRSRGLDRS